ncbi:MAG: hypothetical protein HOA15_02230 [Candidatus Marinimicrobia bacterium]|jgi:hypothetical protein|nr:hypothetical protein [Candidatus Neomarinimicrobiota bacterium]MBT3676562.1 hypothetical protein [Candidatus Neomarinimicrobiota bacterium]MBT3763369.1 hypothetical protein [Candidatus Neomarinimicrobiota bacterium]MBT4069056.1 hypothetical protein [Candidatus Neomarinimicrobiota bacterium]MBT4271134.1 hypothetical protein [Candidatus Neomarinimicrobiota bacterium]
MKRITVFLILLTTLATAQLRIGIDASREESILGISEKKIDGMGFTLGYEFMLLSLIGVGGEYTAGGDEGIDMVYGYAVGKIPVGLPMFRGIVRAGYSMPMGDAADFYDPGLAYGLGLRFKMPLIPVGAEALYTIHSLEMKPDGDGLNELINALEMKYNVMSLVVTYSF